MDGGNGKIKLFGFIQNTCQGIGICPCQLNQSNRILINSKKWFIPFCLTQYLLSSAAYIVIEANSMIEYGMVFFTCITVVFCFTAYLILLWQMGNILNYIENFERFIEKRIHSLDTYQETTEKIERLTKLCGCIYISSNISFVLLPLFHTTVDYYIFDAGNESFVLFSPTWWPFDWRTPFGYLVAWCGQCAGIGAIVVIIVSFFGIIFGSNWLFIVIAKDITNDVAAFNKTVEKLNDNDRMELMKRFCDIIQIYMDAKQCIKDFNEAFEYSFFAFFTWNMVAISSLLVTLQFQLWDDDSELWEIVFLIMVILWVFGFNLVACEPGERVEYQFQKFDIEFERCEWNKLPIEMQRMYLILLSDTQQPKNIRSYGRIMCTRETFKKITAKGFSYFMTLRQFREY